MRRGKGEASYRHAAILNPVATRVSVACALRARCVRVARALRRPRLRPRRVASRNSRETVRASRGSRRIQRPTYLPNLSRADAGRQIFKHAVPRMIRDKIYRAGRLEERGIWRFL